MIPALVMFLVVLSVLLGTYWAFVVRPEEQAAGVVRKRLKRATATVRSIKGALLKEERDLSSVGIVDQILRRAEKLSSPIQDLIDHAGSSTSVGIVLLSSACLAISAFLAGVWFFRAFEFGVILAPIAGALPFAKLRFQRTRRIHKFEEQLPEALDLMARSLRAGHTFTSGIQLVAEEMLPPIGPEFQLLFDRQNYGMPFEEALRDFARRIPVLDAKFFVTAILTQREAGGNLSEILTNLSGVIRERFRVLRQVRVISAHGRITGWVLSGLPPTLGVAFFIISDQHMETMLGSELGRQMMLGAVVLQVLGSLIIRKLVRIEY